MEQYDLEGLKSVFTTLNAGESFPVTAEPHVIERLSHTLEGFKAQPVRNSKNGYIITKQVPSVRQAILNACRQCGFDEVRLDTKGAPMQYVRNLVSLYNRQSGRSVRVRSRLGAVYLCDDIEARETITESEYRDYEAKMYRRLEELAAKVDRWTDSESSDDVIVDDEIVDDFVAVNEAKSCQICGEEFLTDDAERQLCDTCRFTG